MRVLGVAALLTLAACSDKQSAGPPPEMTSSGSGRAPATAPVAQAEALANPAAADYVAVQRAAAIFAPDFLDRQAQGSAASSPDAPRDAKLIVYCTLDDEVTEIGVVPMNEAKRERLARYVAVLREDFRRDKYPEAVWQAPIDRYEADQLAAIGRLDPALLLKSDDGGDYYRTHIAPDTSFKAYEAADSRAFQALLTELNRRRAALSPELPAISDDGGCGAGEQPYHVATEPSGGRLWLQTKFAFDVCKARGGDPWARDTCRWTEVDPRQTRYLAGTYVYQARWADGRQGRGRQIFDGSDGGDDESPVTRLIRPD